MLCGDMWYSSGAKWWQAPGLRGGRPPARRSEGWHLGHTRYCYCECVRNCSHYRNRAPAALQRARNRRGRGTSTMLCMLPTFEEGAGVRQWSQCAGRPPSVTRRCNLLQTRSLTARQSHCVWIGGGGGSGSTPTYRLCTCPVTGLTVTHLDSWRTAR